MRTTANTCLIVSGLLIAFSGDCTVLEAQTRRNYASEWQQAGPSGHTYYLGGYQMGTYNLLLVQWAAEGKVVQANFTQAMRQLTPQQKRALASAVRGVHAERDMEPYGTDVVADVMTTLYRDPANSFIPWDSMIAVAVLRLSGKPPTEVEEWLSIYRQSALARPANP